MLLRRIAAMSAVLVTSSALAPAVTHADTSAASTLYVNNASGSNCSDAAGLGTQAQPFCTIQAAVNVVDPGQTVSIAVGIYEPATISRSGTSTAPIDIVGILPSPTAGAAVSTWIGQIQPLWTGAALTVSGASYVNISTLGIHPGSAGGLVVSHGSNITLNGAAVYNEPSDTGAPLIDVTGASNAVTIERSFVTAAPAAAIQVEGGSTGTVITTDAASSNGTATIVSVNDAPGTDIVSNTLPAVCQTAVAVGQGSQQSVIENNILGQRLGAACPVQPSFVSVDSTAAPTAKDDYNTLSTSETDYSWGGVTYTTPTQFVAGTGQGTHDLINSTPAASIIDSADSAAPGELPTDILGNPRVDDPRIANTGAGPAAYYDRGAYETQEPLTINSYYASAGQAPTGGEVTFTANAIDAWTSSLTYTFDFGDGTTQTSTTGTVTHAYTTTGAFTSKVEVTGSTGIPMSRTFAVTIVPPAPEVAAMSLTSTGSMTAIATQQSTDAWSLTGYSVDFGDGTTPMQAVEGTPRLIHSYTKLGTFTVTLTTTDADGNTAITSQQFSTAGSEYTAYGPVRVLDTRHGVGTGGVVAKLGANQTLHLQIAGNGAIPANASAVAFNLTVTNPTAGGDLVAFPDEQPMPATSNLNFTPGLTKATNVIVGVGADGEVSLYNGSAGTVDLVADVNGYFTQSMANGYTPTPPTRILDTRRGTGTNGVVAKVGSGKALTLPLGGEVPTSGVAAVVLNLTAVDEATGGYVTAYPDGTLRPLASSLNFAAGQIVPNTVIVPVGQDGKIDLYNGSGGPIDLVADVQGYFSAGSADTYVPGTPVRLYDSRALGGPFHPNNNSIVLYPLGTNPVINTALSNVAYVYNVTVAQTAGAGYVTVYPVSEGLPLASNVNFTAGQTTANTAITQGSTYGAGDEFTATFTLPASSTQLIVDLFGYFSAE